MTDPRAKLYGRAVEQPNAGQPTGWRWRLTTRFTTGSRQARFELFMRTMRPTPDTSILDVGVNDTEWRSSNFLEASYPWPERITAVGIEPMPTFQRLFPEVRFLVADGRDLPFADEAYDVAFSNAVVEHVGSRVDQRQFVGELVRTARRVFISTPDACIPIDPHTLLPFVHWLPPQLRHRILRLTGNGRWASEDALNPLTAAELRRLFPPDVRVRVHRQRLLGIATVLTAVAEAEQRGKDA